MDITFPSFGVFVAVSIPKMTTLESIRKRKALLGKSKEEYDAFREKWENVYYELGKKLQPDANGFDDYGYWRLIEAVGHKNPKEFIKKQYGIEVSEENMAQLNEMLNAIRTEYPARYFETKFERPLQLSDFTAAVVPNDIPLDVESRLKDAGVEVIEYEKGDNASRAEAMQKASAMEGVRFSLQETNDRFNAELDAFKAGQNISELHLGVPSPLLRACGVSASEIFITAKTLRDHLKKHNLTEDEIKNLPIAINSPIMVYEWGEKAKSKIIITQIPRGEQRITVAIKMERGGRRLAVNELASVHGKDVERLMNEMLTTKSDFGKDNLKYVNKEIAMQWLGIAPPEGAASLTDAQQSIANIIQNFQNPKIEARNYLISPEMDADYLSAVERGDMATAQQMVMEAAKLAMPNTKVVDENGNPKVVYHYSNKPKIRVFNPFRRTEELTGVEIEKLGKIRESFNEGKRPLIRPFMGIWATPIRGEYADYGKYEYALFADIRSPRVTDKVSPNLSGDKNADGTFSYSNGVLYEVSTILPERFKSADPVTYDDNGNVIPLSERFNPEKEDIRYSVQDVETERFNRKVDFVKDMAREYNIYNLSLLLRIQRSIYLHLPILV